MCMNGSQKNEKCLKECACNIVEDCEDHWWISHNKSLALCKILCWHLRYVDFRICNRENEILYPAAYLSACINKLIKEQLFFSIWSDLYINVLGWQLGWPYIRILSPLSGIRRSLKPDSHLSSFLELCWIGLKTRSRIFIGMQQHSV